MELFSIRIQRTFQLVSTQEMQFKTTESGATAHICTDKNRCGDGQESQTEENTET